MQFYELFDYLKFNFYLISEAFYNFAVFAFR